MARRKNKNASPAPEDGGLRENQSQKNKPGGVSMATCAGGMFLCLVIGLYIGSLIPGILADMDKSANTAASARMADNIPPRAMPTDAPIPAAQADTLNSRITALEKKTEVEPNNPDAWVNLGNLYFDSNLYDKAIHAYGHALELRPDNPDVLTDMGIMYRETGEYNKALECFKKASAINPGHINALFNEGVVLANDLGDKAGAVKAWQRVLEISPGARAPDGRSVSEMIKSAQ